MTPEKVQADRADVLASTLNHLDADNHLSVADMLDALAVAGLMLIPDESGLASSAYYEHIKAGLVHD